MKICSKKDCIFSGQLQSFENFYKDRNGKFQRYHFCKACTNEKRSNFYSKNKTKIDQRNKVYAENHKNIKKEYDKQRRFERKEIIKLEKQKYYQTNKKQINQKLIEKRRKDIQSKLAANLRRRLWGALNGEAKIGSAVKNLGCSPHELKNKFEQMFYSHPSTGETMTWENYGFYGWHIDHVAPLCSFDLTNVEQLKKACHFTNLRPRWAIQNLSENDRGMSRNQKHIKEITE